MASPVIHDVRSSPTVGRDAAGGIEGVSRLSSGLDIKPPDGRDGDVFRSLTGALLPVRYILPLGLDTRAADGRGRVSFLSSHMVEL